MIESEKILEKLLGDEIKKHKGFCFKLLANYVAGLPDRICLLPGGIIFFAEIKTTKKKPTKIQLAIHKKIRNLGFEVFVIDTSEQIKKLIENKNIKA